MTFLQNMKLNPAQISLDAGARVRVGQLTTLGDYKTLDADRAILWENTGTGSGTFGSINFKEF